MKSNMKSSFSLFLALALVLSLMGTQVFAADARAMGSGSVDNINISTQGGKAIELLGHIEPTIISVTMPAYIPFDMSRSVTTPNKAVSPKIYVQNNSLVPVTVTVDNNRVDLSRLAGTSWSNDGDVLENQIAIGFVESVEQPVTLSGALWLKNGLQNTSLLNLNAKAGSSLYVVGDLGRDVPENQSFTATPNLVVRASY